MPHYLIEDGDGLNEVHVKAGETLASMGFSEDAIRTAKRLPRRRKDHERLEGGKLVEDESSKRRERGQDRVTKAEFDLLVARIAVLEKAAGVSSETPG